MRGISTNIYNSDGSISSQNDNRNINLNGKNLIFSGDGKVGMGTNNPTYKLDVAGVVKASALDYNSDLRLKQNIIPLKNSSEIILNLIPVTYFWNKDGVSKGGDADRVQYGFIAQEVEKILPEIIKTENDGYKTMNYDALIPILVKTIQEQNLRILELEKKLLN